MGALAWTSDDGIVTIAVNFDSYVREERCRWELKIEVERQPESYIYTSRNLESADYDYFKALQSLASFLGAWAEAREEGDNATLFPVEMKDALDADWNIYAEEFWLDVTPPEER